MCIDTDMCVSSVQDYLICPICCCIFCLDSVVVIYFSLIIINHRIKPFKTNLGLG